MGCSRPIILTVKMNREVNEGVFIRLGSDEAKEIWSALTELGYTTNAEGMKNFLLDNLFEETPHTPGPIEELIARNPEALERAGAVLLNGIKNAYNRFKKTA